MKTHEPAGCAVSKTRAPPSKLASHALPQSMPAGAEATLPWPWIATVSRCLTGCGTAVNRAVTARSRSIVSVQDAVPPHAPSQPAKAKPRAGAAVSVTDVPPTNSDAHVAPQSMPAGEDVTVPEPLTETTRWFELATTAGDPPDSPQPAAHNAATHAQVFTIPQPAGKLGSAPTVGE